MPIAEEIDKRHKKRNYLIELLNNYTLELEKKFGNVTIILFGSYARGDFNLWSDVDIIIISDVFNKIRFLDRPFLLPELDKQISYSDIICWSYEESKYMLNKSLWKDALQNSVVIKDDYNLY